MNKYAPGAELEVPWEHSRCLAPRINREGIHPDLWSSPPGTTASAEATRLCFEECPIRLQCLEFACVSKEAESIWGGLEPKVRCDSRDGTTKNHDFDALKGVPNPYANPEGPYWGKTLIPWEAGVDEEGVEPSGVTLPQYPRYIVTRLGAVWNRKGKFNNAQPLTLPILNGKVRVYLYPADTVTTAGARSECLPLAEVVAAAYLSYPLKSKIPVYHINGDPLDNRVENLTWTGETE
ncbi:WhiB family transcriptional regulator [Streptomyces sp. NPDC005385]|uniref:WhiB family transcriptional regulator n=1 Tax=Streptomyces sp. NPDC005385 TaxID=3157039 RepID=UPI0033BF16BE